MKGYIGIDEVGRGPLAGPVTVCALYIKDKKEAEQKYFNQIIRDSKRLTKDKRERIFQIIRQNSKLNKNIIYSISSRSAKYIDKNGINKTITFCIHSCLKSLKNKGVDVKNIKIQLDGGLYVDKSFKNQKTYIKGDEKYVSIALASIVAKVTRDNYMKKLARAYDCYGWDSNVGYGTEIHRKAIKKQGVTKYHRLSYLNRILLK